jgi:phosphoglycerate kinase
MTRKRNVHDVLEEVKSKDGKKNVLIRVDFNVPMQDGKITDDSRIRGAMPTIKEVIKANCNAVLMSHMGRPKLVQSGEDTPEAKAQKEELSLKPVAEHLSSLLETPVLFAEDCANAKETVDQLPEGGGVVLLNNLRFYKAEEKNGEDFAKTLASYGVAYINDAFGTSHRAHASVSGIPALLDKKLCGIGLLVQSELSYLDFSNKSPDEKVAAIIGGSKVSTKLPVIKGLIDSVDVLILCGGLAFTFIKGYGVSIGTSLCEDDMIETANGFVKDAEAKGKKMVIPIDSVGAQSFPKGPMDKKDTKVFDVAPGASGIEEGWMGLDAGPKTLAAFKEALAPCKKIIYNGPPGVFEVEPFDEGSRALVNALEEFTKAGATTVVGGGDSVASLEKFGKMDAVSYVSTGGGATLELLAGDVLPGVAAIADVED